MSETQRGQNLQGLGLLYLNAFEAWNNGIPQQGKAYFLLGLKQLTFALLLGRGCLRGGHGSVSFTWLVCLQSRKLSTTSILPETYQHCQAFSSISRKHTFPQL